MAHCTLLGMGNPLLDISAEISDTAILTKYGLKMGNAILAGPEHAGLYDELVATYGDKVVYVAGGATQNSVRVAQWMSGAPAGWAAYVGCVGADAYGATLAKCAEADGVAVLYQVTAAAPTGTCAVLVHDTERSMCANLAASEALSPEHADSPAVAAAIASAKVVYNAGFPLTHAGGAAIAERLAKACAKSGAVYATNLSAPFLCQFFKERVAMCIHYADYVFGNETEAAAYAAANGMEGASVEAVAAAISAAPKASGARGRVAIITQGASATVVAAGGVVTSYPVPAVANIVDSNGAGDAFVGGFLAYIARGASVKEAVDAGHWAAGHVIQRSGCSFDRNAKYVPTAA